MGRVRQHANRTSPRSAAIGAVHLEASLRNAAHDDAIGTESVALFRSSPSGSSVQAKGRSKMGAISIWVDRRKGAVAPAAASPYRRMGKSDLILPEPAFRSVSARPDAIERDGDAAKLWCPRTGACYAIRPSGTTDAQSRTRHCARHRGRDASHRPARACVRGQRAPRLRRGKADAGGRRWPRRLSCGCSPSRRRQTGASISAMAARRIRATAIWGFAEGPADYPCLHEPARGHRAAASAPRAGNGDVPLPFAERAIGAGLFQR